MLRTHRFSFPKEQLVASEGEVASFPPLDELPADLLLLQLAFHQRLPVLVHLWGGDHRAEVLSASFRQGRLCCSAEYPQFGSQLCLRSS